MTARLSKSAFGLGVSGSSKASGIGGAIGGQFTAASTAAKTLRTDLAVLAPAYSEVATPAERLSMVTRSLGGSVKPLAGGFARAAGPAAGLALATSGIADGMGLSNTATLALMGTIAGPWGAAVGGGLGLLLDWRAHSAAASEAAAEFTGTLDTQTGALTENTRALAVKKPRSPVPSTRPASSA